MTARYAFMRAHIDEHCLRTMCRVLGVHRSGYYVWRRHWGSARKREDNRFLRLIKQNRVWSPTSPTVVETAFALAWNTHRPVVLPGELPVQRHVVQRFLHRRSDKPNHCCRKWMRSIASIANGGRPRLPSGAYGAISITRSATAQPGSSRPGIRACACVSSTSSVQDRFISWPKCSLAH